MTNTSSASTRRTTLQGLVLTGLFTALLLVMGFTPLGLIDLPIIKATILHVPVIIGSVLLGPKKGAFLGGVFGAISLWKNTMAPSLLSFAFSPFVPLPGQGSGSPWALAISFVPRILVGVIPYFVVKLFELIPSSANAKIVLRGISYGLAGVVGAAVNTGLVMSLIGLVLGSSFAAAQGISADAVAAGIMGIVFANGIPEAIAAGVLTPALCLPLGAALSHITGRKVSGK
jgi:uncharacterized membrane protein